MDHHRSDRLNFYHQLVWYDLETGGGHPLPKVRERAAGLALTLEETAELANLDAIAIDYLMGSDDDQVWPALLEGDPTQPLQKWWWHLGKLRQGNYPADLLPPHLQAIYSGRPLTKAA